MFSTLLEPIRIQHYLRWHGSPVDRCPGRKSLRHSSTATEVFRCVSLAFDHTMITTSERAALKTFGYTLLENMTGITTSALIYGVFVLLFSLSTTSVHRRRFNPPATWAMFGTTMLSFVLATVYCTTSFAGSVMYVQQRLLNLTMRGYTASTVVRSK